MQQLTADQIERAIDAWKPEKRRDLLLQLAKRYRKDFRNNYSEKDIESLGWMILAQSSLGFWDNTRDAIYDRM